MTKEKINPAPRAKSDYFSKLKKLEEEKQKLILQRKEEIFAIIDKTGCLSVDNELLSGAFTLLKEIGEIQRDALPEDLKQFEQIMRGMAPIFFRRKSKSSKPTTESNYT